MISKSLSLTLLSLLVGCALPKAAPFAHASDPLDQRDLRNGSGLSLTFKHRFTINLPDFGGRHELVRWESEVCGFNYPDYCWETRRNFYSAEELRQNLRVEKEVGRLIPSDDVEITGQENHVVLVTLIQKYFPRAKLVR